MNFKEYINVSESIAYHQTQNIPISESVYRMHSNSYYELISEARTLYSNNQLQLSESDQWLFDNTDIGLFETYEGNLVPLDIPFMIAEEENVKLNKPKRGGSKKFYVYVKDPKTGNVKKVSWGDTSGLSVKMNDPAARKSFAARHQCHLQKDKTTAAYWACNLPRYAKQLGMSGGGSFYW